MKNIASLFAVLIFTIPGFTQKNIDIKHIKDLCGCFDVEFKYAETFAPDEEYQYHNRERISQATELVIPVEQTNKKIVLQHLLVVNDTMVIKHWREDWEFEKPELLNYYGNYIWEKQPLDPKHVKNKWTQTVWEVSDAPRYQGVSEWVTTDGKTFWMNTTDAPLPRREYTKRKDYNILKRRNIIIVGQDGWIHEQDNQKVVRSGGKDTVLAEEKGMNTYKRMDESKCAAAKKYWEENKEYWIRVRSAWDNYLSSHQTVSVKPLLNGKPLHQVLSEIEQDYSSQKITMEVAETKIRSALDAYVNDGSMAGE